MIRALVLLALLAMPLRAATIVDRSGTISLGGIAQTLMAANSSRIGCAIQNQSVNDLWFYELGTAAAVAPSHLLTPGSEWLCPSNGIPTGAFSIFGAVTGQAFQAKEWQ